MVEHKWSYCELCRCDMVLCGTCGNNTCNAGYGTVDGRPCRDCESAYRMMYRRVLAKNLAAKAKSLMFDMRKRLERDPDKADFTAAFELILQEDQLTK